jgi:hypothetical protein
MNFDELNLLDCVLLVLWSPSPTLASLLGCRQEILLEHISPKIQFSTFSAKFNLAIVNIVTIRQCKISLWWAR